MRAWKCWTGGAKPLREKDCSESVNNPRRSFNQDCGESVNNPRRSFNQEDCGESVNNPRRTFNQSHACRIGGGGGGLRSRLLAT